VCACVTRPSQRCAKRACVAREIAIGAASWPASRPEPAKRAPKLAAASPVSQWPPAKVAGAKGPDWPPIRPGRPAHLAAKSGVFCIINGRRFPPPPHPLLATPLAHRATSRRANLEKPINRPQGRPLIAPAHTGCQSIQSAARCKRSILLTPSLAPLLGPQINACARTQARKANHRQWQHGRRSRQQSLGHCKRHARSPWARTGTGRRRARALRAGQLEA